MNASVGRVVQAGMPLKNNSSISGAGSNDCNV